MLADGTRLESDVVVLATGFERSRVAAERLMGPEVMRRVGALGELDEEQERIAVSAPSPSQRTEFVFVSSLH